MPGELPTKTEAFEVLAIDQMARPDPRGTIKDTYRVSILTKGGIRLTRELEAEEMEEKKFVEILTKEAHKYDKLKSLRG